MQSDIRVIGKPQGVEIMYIEDYVYSFMKIALYEKKYKQIEVIFLGTEKTENQKHYYHISGMVFDEDETAQFENLQSLGIAHITCSSEDNLEIQLRTKKDKIVEFNSYYIYYEENEQMKKYMLSFVDFPQEAAMHEAPVGTIKLPEPIPIGGLGEILKYFAAVCIMAYVIISMNHYRKLEMVEEQAVYIMNTISQEDTFYTP